MGDALYEDADAILSILHLVSLLNGSVEQCVESLEGLMQLSEGKLMLACLASLRYTGHSLFFIYGEREQSWTSVKLL